MAASAIYRPFLSKLRHALSGQFLAGVIKLAGAAALAQALLFGALVVATRIYSPADFGVLAVFNALVTTVGVGACFRFDIAVPLPPEEKDAVNMLALAVLCAVFVAFGVSLLLALAPETVTHHVFDRNVHESLWLVGPAIFFLAAMSSLQHWFIRRKAYGIVATSRIGQALAHVIVQLGGGWVIALPVFLVLAQTVNYATAVASLACVFLLQSRGLLRQVNVSRMRTLAYEYRQFPIYSTWEALFNSAGMFVPIILIAAFAPSAEVGHLQLGLYAIQAMIGLVGASVSQVYFSKAAEEHRAGHLSPFTGVVLGNLAKAGPGPLLAVGIISPVLFPVVFGQEWTRSGILVAWMTPWFVLQFLASPISLALVVTRRQKAAFLLQLFGFVFRSGAVLLAAYTMEGYVTEVYALSGFVFYAVYLATILSVANVSILNILREQKAISIISMLFVCAACIAAMALMVIF